MNDDTTVPQFDDTKECRASDGSVWWRDGDNYTNGLYRVTVDEMRTAWETGQPFSAKLIPFDEHTERQERYLNEVFGKYGKR